MSRILVVDDEPSMQELLGIMLRKEGHAVTVAGSRAAAESILAKDPPTLVITDLKLPDGDGLEILRRVKSFSPETVVIVMTAYGSTQTAVAALKTGAYDYLVKPFDVDELRIVIRNALEKRRLEEENVLLKAEFQSKHRLEGVIGAAPAMKAVLEMVRAVAPTSSTVLITGESGTGKEVVAKALHALSPRREHPFVSINCGALPETLLESELFGHVRGAFTDARQSKKGLFEAAHRGTLFLDEIGEMTPAMQVKLLRTLQDKRVRRVGGTEEIEVDARVLAATNRPLETLVKEGRFREDLLYRLNVIPILIPPLRQRREDIPLLAEHCLQRFAREMDKRVLAISEPAMKRLLAHAWPGNVRELENVIERAVALEPTDRIELERLPETLLGPRTAPVEPVLGPGFQLGEHLREAEAGLVRLALEQSGGDRRGAADVLGVSPRMLRYLIKKHRIGVAAVPSEG